MYYSSYSSRAETAAILTIVALVLAIAATVVIAILIMPKKKRARFTGFLAMVHDLVNFKNLFIEIILRVLYVFSTVFVVFLGFFLLFAGNSFWECAAMMFVGPFAVRLLYEGMMLFVLCVQNVIEINRKLDKPGFKSADAPDLMSSRSPDPAPARAPEPAPVYKTPKIVFCCQCGTRYDANSGPCPNCGSVNPN